ncbi:hypothetical protein [Cohnella hongkongensis]|uniref:Transposase n=1 Tax=Cohnella hongkongensis TaxID=178337 RepID=A0ABV9FDZ3_9BACL
MGDFRQLYRQLNMLPKERKLPLYKQISKLVGYEDSANREAKYSSKCDIICPKCGSASHVVGHGTTKPGSDRRRYKCKSCLNLRGNKGYTFNDYTSGVLHKLRSPKNLVTFLEFMLEGLPLRKIADVMGMSKTTALSWRHKVLHAISKLHPQLNSGVIEVMEIPVKPSRKGLPRKNRSKSTAAAPDRLIVAHNRDGHVFLGTKDQLSRLTERYLTDDSLPAWTLHNAVSIQLNCSKAAQQSSISIRLQLLHTRNVQLLSEEFHSMHSTSMRGVATRNLSHYAAWQQYLSNTKSQKPIARLRNLLHVCL